MTCSRRRNAAGAPAPLQPGLALFSMPPTPPLPPHPLQAGAVMDEVVVSAAKPPARPSSVPLALQQSMPLAGVLSAIAKPPSG